MALRLLHAVSLYMMVLQIKKLVLDRYLTRLLLLRYLLEACTWKRCMLRFDSSLSSSGVSLVQQYYLNIVNILPAQVSSQRFSDWQKKNVTFFFLIIFIPQLLGLTELSYICLSAWRGITFYCWGPAYSFWRITTGNIHMHCGFLYCFAKWFLLFRTYFISSYLS